MRTIQFMIPSIPIAQPRQRHRIIAAASGATYSQNYTPTRHPVNAFKAAARLAAQNAYSGPPLDGPIWASFSFIMPRPRSKPAWIKRGTKLHEKWRRGDRVPFRGKPDRDNLMKSLQDALNGWWADDALVYDGPVGKWYAASNETPHVFVRLELED